MVVHVWKGGVVVVGVRAWEQYISVLKNLMGMRGS